MKTKIKTSFSVCLIACCLMTSTNSQAAVTIRGLQSCGTWVKDRKEGGVAETADKLWLLGYMSGLSVGSSKNILQGTDNESIYLWMDNYCRSNPLKDLADGGLDLYLELLQQKKMK